MKNNNAWAIVIAVVIIALVIFLAMRGRNDDDMINDPNTSQNGDQSAVEPEGTEDISQGSATAGTTTGTAPVTLSYQNALTKYANARIQFNPACAATPSNATFKNGATIMLDNRSPAARTFKIGSMGSYSVKAYGFKLITLNAGGVLPNAMMVDCGLAQNVATITVQK